MFVLILVVICIYGAGFLIAPHPCLLFRGTVGVRRSMFLCVRVNNDISLQQMKIIWCFKMTHFGFWLCRGIAEAACGAS